MALRGFRADRSMVGAIPQLNIGLEHRKENIPQNVFQTIYHCVLRLT